MTPNGFLLIDKPSGPTSYDIIRWIKPKLTGVKIGHSGTLDPLASGLLVVLLGKATKSQADFMKQEKTYRFRLRLGTASDTGDRMGRVTEEKPVPSFDEGQWACLLREFEGDGLQVPPMYSAVKHRGQPLYKLARKGKDVKRDPRPVRIRSMDLLAWNGKDELEIRARVSSGTYVRVLGEDVAKKAGTCAMVTTLRREKIGSFGVDESIDAVTLERLSPAELAGKIRPVEAAWRAAV